MTLPYLSLSCPGLYYSCALCYAVSAQTEALQEVLMLQLCFPPLFCVAAVMKSLSVDAAHAEGTTDMIDDSRKTKNSTQR